jgi:hypothetical protein
MADSVEQVLADERGQAAVLRANGHGLEARIIERVCDSVSESLREYLTWLSEPDARLRSGRTVEWLRGRFAEWASEGMAEVRGGRRYYRAVIIPLRAHTSAAVEAGARGETAS